MRFIIIIYIYDQIRPCQTLSDPVRPLIRPPISDPLYLTPYKPYQICGRCVRCVKPYA
jgi:hypothetical protein